MYTIVLTSPIGRRRTYSCDIVGNRATACITNNRLGFGHYKSELVLEDDEQSRVLSTGAVHIHHDVTFPVNVTMVVPSRYVYAQGSDETSGMIPDIVLM